MIIKRPRTSSVHDTPQVKYGEMVELWLDGFFGSRGWQVKATSDDEHHQHKGDSRLVRDTYNKTIEYKSDRKTHETGNLFLETVSANRNGQQTPGWVYTCQASYLVYAAILNKILLVISPNELREKIGNLKRQFPIRQTGNHLNAGYFSEGILVPLHYALQHLAFQVIGLTQGDVADFRAFAQKHGIEV